MTFERARGAFAAGDYEAARVGFRRAYVLSPRYALLYNVGLAELMSGHDAEALEAFEAFLRQAPADDAQRAEVEERVRVLRQLGADRAPGTPAPPEAPALHVEGGPEDEPRGELEPAAEPAPAPDGEPSSGGVVVAEPPPRASADEASGSDPGPWILTGVGGAVVVAGVVSMAVGADAASRLVRPLRPAPLGEFEQLRQEAELAWGIGLGLVGAGLAVAGSGLVWGLSSGGGPEDASASLRLAPGGLVVEGRF